MADAVLENYSMFFMLKKRSKLKGMHSSDTKRKLNKINPTFFKIFRKISSFMFLGAYLW